MHAWEELQALQKGRKKKGQTEETGKKDDKSRRRSAWQRDKGREKKLKKTRTREK